MTDTLRIKRRAAGGAAGPPTVGTFEAAGLAFNEQDNVLYYGKGNSANLATSVIPIGGPGAFLPIGGGALTGGINFGSVVDTSAASVAAHISLYGGNQYGFGVTSARLNYNSAGSHVFLASGVDKVTINTAGISMATATDIALIRDPSNALHAATMQYVDAVITRNGGPFLPTVGGTVSGATTFSVGGVTMSGGSAAGVALQVSAHTSVGVDLSTGVFTAPAIRLATSQAIGFVAAGNRLLYYDGVTAPFGLKYGTGSVAAPGPVITLGDSGTITAAGVTLSGLATFNGDIVSNAGIGFGATVAPGGVTDLTRHIELYSTTYGFSVTANRLNYVAPAVAAHVFNDTTADIVTINSAGLSLTSGSTTDITLARAPSLALHAVTKSYVDGLVGEPVNVKWQAYGATGNGSTDDTTAIQNALNTGLDVYLPGGTYIISRQLSMTTYGQRVLGAGRSRTFIKVNGPSAANFPTGIIYVNNAAMAGGGDFNVAFADFTMWCVQPDTSVRANLNNYPPMIMLDHAARSQMTNVRLVGGMIGLHMEGNNGGFRAYGCDFGCFYININIDGNLDVTSFVDCEVWCFSATGIMTVNQQKVFWDANCYGIYSKRNDYFDWKGGLLMVGRSAQFDMGTRSDWPGPTYGHFTGCGFDSFGGLGVSAGSILTDNCTFSVGGDPNGIRSGNAVVHTGGVVTIRGGKFFVGTVSLIPAQALIWTGCGSGVASIIIENCEFEMGGADVRAIYAETSNNAYDSIQISNNKFSRLAGYSYANAAVQINGGGGTLTGNVCGPGAGAMTGTVPALGMAAGIGTWLTANNNWHGWLTSVTGSSVTAQNLLQLPPVVGDAMAITQVNGNATIGGMTILGEIGASAAFAGIFITLLFTGTCTVNSGSYAVAGQFLLNNGTAFSTRTGSHLSVRLSVTGNWVEVGRCY